MRGLKVLLTLTLVAVAAAAVAVKAVDRGAPSERPALEVAAAVPANVTEPRTLEWLDLLPDADREAMERLPEEMEKLNEKLLAEGVDELTDEVEMPAVLSSTSVRSDLAGQYVRIPGFIVPIELNERGDTTGFFVVPYFGACIHLPPPPPNQIVYVTFPAGVPADQIYEPYWIAGTMSIETTENELGLSTYSIDAKHIEVYTEPEQ